MRNAILRQADDGRVVEDGEFQKRLRDLVATVEKMRDQLTDLVPTAPNDDAEWIAVMSSREVTEALGALVLLSAKNAGWANAIVNQILTVLAQRMLPERDPGVVDGVIDGQVRAEMSCACRQCEVCLLRAKVGDEKAAAHIEKMLRPKEAQRIILAN